MMGVPFWGLLRAIFVAGLTAVTSSPKAHTFDRNNKILVFASSLKGDPLKWTLESKV